MKYLPVRFYIVIVGFILLFTFTVVLYSKRFEFVSTKSWPKAPSAEAGASNRRELNRILESREYQNALTRVNGGKITPEDYELLLKVGELQGRLIKEPQLEKYTKYPPDDAKGLALWQWWTGMSEVDANFAYKRRIVFYGKVVDEQENPVPGVKVVATIQGLHGLKDLELSSDAAGLFQIEGERGKDITIDMDKPGYRRGPKSYGTFEYAEFYSERFHQADPNNPVVFVLPRLDP